MSNKYHQMVIALNYSEYALPTFDTPAEQDAWHQALGRMVAFGLLREAEDDSTRVVVGHVGRNPTEVLMCYYPPVLATRDAEGFTRTLGTPKGAMDGILGDLLDKGWHGYGFTMGAVLHNDGKWGYHS
jgi:hypothetical protein